MRVLADWTRSLRNERLQAASRLEESAYARAQRSSIGQPNSRSTVRGIRSQIIRSALSIPANIVEGREQTSEAGFARYLRISLGSTSELEYHLTAARDIQVLGEKEYQSLSSK